jgi:hypothetical protein
MDLNNYYSKKYLKYKKKYLDLKGNGPNLQVGDKLISYYNPSYNKHIFNEVEITAIRNLGDGSIFYQTKTKDKPNGPGLHSSNEKITWIRKNDLNGFNNSDVQNKWSTHGNNPNKPQKQSSPAASPPNVFRQPMSSQSTFSQYMPSQTISSTNRRDDDIKVNINLPIIMNEGILERVNICLNNGGKIEHAHHLTLYSGTTDNYNDLKIITTNSSSIKNVFFRECPTNVDTGTGGYKILGQSLPDDIKQIINFNDNLNNLNDSYGSENNERKGVFLAKVFFGNNVNFTPVYNEIKKGTSNLTDTGLYTRDKYDNFTLHLSLAKFDNVGQALTALGNIYSSRLQSGFQNYFNNQRNFAKHLNISIN